jgi:hypothetical protein
MKTHQDVDENKKQVLSCRTNQRVQIVTSNFFVECLQSFSFQIICFIVYGSIIANHQILSFILFLLIFVNKLKMTAFKAEC